MQLARLSFRGGYDRHQIANINENRNAVDDMALSLRTDLSITCMLMREDAIEILEPFHFDGISAGIEEE